MVNGVWITGRSLQSTLSSFATNLVLVNDDEVFTVSLVGSATYLRFRGRYLLCCSQHQLVGQDPERVSILHDDGSVAISSGGISYFGLSQDTDAYDIAVFDFTSAAAAHPFLKRRCFSLDERPHANAAEETIAYIAAGYPSTAQNYDLAETRSIGLRRYSVTCRTSSTSGTDEAILELDPIEKPTVAIDGMSGGPVFRVSADGLGFRVELGGMILQGGAGRLRVLRSELMFDFLTGVLNLRGF